MEDKQLEAINIVSKSIFKSIGIKIDEDFTEKNIYSLFDSKSETKEFIGIAVSKEELDTNSKYCSFNEDHILHGIFPYKQGLTAISDRNRKPVVEFFTIDKNLESIDIEKFIKYKKIYIVN